VKVLVIAAKICPTFEDNSNT